MDGRGRFLIPGLWDMHVHIGGYDEGTKVLPRLVAYGITVPPIHEELVALVRAGMTPLEALQASTRNAAESLGRLAGEGTVEVGKKANLVLLEADPLTDIANTRRVAAVVLGGRLIPGPETERLR